MTTLRLNKDELLNKLKDLAETYEYLEKKNDELVKVQDHQRAQWRKHYNTYRENHKEKFNEYMRVKTLQYYNDNKEKISERRKERYKQKKEEKRLKELAEKNYQVFKETLGKIDS